MAITSFARCDCGAVTLYDDSSENNWSVDEALLPIFAPDISLSGLEELPHTFSCNHCVNRWGLDLCGCGSGDLYSECQNGFSECGTPMQVLGGRTSVYGKDALAQRIAAFRGELSNDAEKDMNDEETLADLYQQAAALAAKSSAACSRLTERICSEIRKKPLEEVNRISCSPDCFSVSCSAVFSHDNMSVEYYSELAQSDLVGETLKRIQDAGIVAYIDRIKQIVSDGFVERTSGGFKQRYRLNPNTLRVLREVTNV